MRHIRPHQLFGLLQAESSPERVVKLMLPPGRTPGEPLLLDTAVLLTLAKIVRAGTVFEFGTYLGIMTLNLAMNLPQSSRMFTLDLDPDAFDRIRHLQHEEDRAISQIHFKENSHLAFLDAPHQERITRLLGDSREFDFSEYKRNVDMVYVDGGHDVHTAKSDSENALAMLSPDSAACVVWHDYGNPSYPGLTDYLEALSRELDIFHVEETMLCFFLSNAPEHVTNGLLSPSHLT